MIRLPIKLPVLTLIAITAILGFAIYRQYDRPAPSSLPVGSREKADLDMIRRVPDQRAPEEVKRAYNELMNRIAEDASVLEITGCAAKPLALKVAEGNTVTIRNADDVVHTLNLGQQKFAVPAKGAAMLTAKFDTGPGIYGYGCDTGLSIIGVFHVTPR